MEIPAEDLSSEAEDLFSEAEDSSGKLKTLQLGDRNPLRMVFSSVSLGVR